MCDLVKGDINNELVNKRVIYNLVGIKGDRFMIN